MLQTQPSRSVFRLPPPPLWFVTNGELTVGPVVTSLLIRGVEHGRVPEYCHVRAHEGDWRALLGVREIAALYGKVSHGPSPEQLAEWGRSVERVRDEDELCHTVTWLSLIATGAESAMFHYRGRYGRTLFTRSIIGPVTNARLGYPLSEHDPVLRCARHGIPVQGPPYGPVEDELAKRFATSQGGVGAAAMIPILVEGQLAAMLELSRPGHAFRRTDLQRAERIVQRGLGVRVN
ncbi:MAG: GAF domain-containing protein [Myxococcota bacterium]